MDEEPSAPLPVPTIPHTFINPRQIGDTRTFEIGERVFVRNPMRPFDIVMAKTVGPVSGGVVDVLFIGTSDFPSKLAKGIDRKVDVDPLAFDTHSIGKADVPDDPSGGRRRRSASKRVRNITRRHRKRKGSRKLGLKFL
jgi:hypothetical protein